jgi:hypothetical protein
VFGPNTCREGFVWREADDTDWVCVVPTTRSRTRTENALAPTRRSPTGEQCGSLGRYPQFSHVLLCVTPGLYIESTPAALLRDHDKPAVRTVRAEEYDHKKRSDLLVMRPRALSGNPDLNAKITQRSVFHHDRPYNFRPVSASKDALRCSELVATIYADLGIQLVPERKLHETLPFDIELAIDKADGWLDVTELYIMAETLCDQRLIKERNPDLRDMFFQQYASGAEITKLLNEWGKAADATLKDIHAQMTRPVQILPSEKRMWLTSKSLSLSSKRHRYRE